MSLADAYLFSPSPCATVLTDAMHGGVRPIEITHHRGKENESTSERRQVIGNGRNKRSKRDRSHGPCLSRELQQLTEEMSREFSAKRRIKIANLPSKAHEKVRT